MIKNILSVDLESFIHRELDIQKRKKDDGFTVKATEYLLDLFHAYNTKVTFFIVGEIFEWYPQLLDKIAAKGHEIGYHGHSHIKLKDKNVLLEELKKSEKFLKKYKPLGFRAPRMYLTSDSVSVLRDFGFTYDSSVYGDIGEELSGNGITEIPVSLAKFIHGKEMITLPQNLTAGLLFKGIPYGSGLGIGIFQKKTQYFITHSNRSKLPSVLCIHPWQFFDYDLDIPLKSVTDIFRFIYKRKINITIEYLLSKNKFITAKEFLYGQ